LIKRLKGDLNNLKNYIVDFNKYIESENIKMKLKYEEKNVVIRHGVNQRQLNWVFFDPVFH
jgi:hypothetical protein